MQFAKSITITIISCAFLVWPITAICEQTSWSPSGNYQQTAHPNATPIVIVESPTATKFFTANEPVVRKMIDTGICTLLKVPTSSNAWRKLLSSNDIVGIKIYTRPGLVCGSRLGLVEQVVSSILDSEAVPHTNIIVWDKFPSWIELKEFKKLETKYGIRVLNTIEAGFDTNYYYESPLMGQPMWGDTGFGSPDQTSSKKSFVSNILTKNVTKIILITPLVSHPKTGICGHLLHLSLDSVDNTQRFLKDVDTLAVAVPEICAMEQIGDKLVLCFTDALLCQYEGGPTGQPHYSIPLNQIWISMNPVGLDLLGLQQINTLRAKLHLPPILRSLSIWENAALLRIGSLDTNNSVVIKLPHEDQPIITLSTNQVR